MGPGGVRLGKSDLEAQSEGSQDPRPRWRPEVAPVLPFGLEGPPCLQREGASPPALLLPTASFPRCSVLG